MRRELAASLIVSGFLAAHSSTVLSAPVCVPSVEAGVNRCTITKAADCDKVADYPYARDLFCGAAFSAAQAMVTELEKTLGVKAPTDGFFYYYQTLPDPDAQTTVSCMDTLPPYPASKDSVVGAGLPLCNLIANVTSAGGDAKKTRKDNPIAKDLHTFPEFFSGLYSPERKHPLSKFRSGSAFDPIVNGLGANAADGFLSDYKKFSATKLYAPGQWAKDSQYRGISGGGGSGWGGEIAVVGTQGPVVQLAFGGGGGGGMTSQSTAPNTASSTLGAGGGGGVQFANGYKFNGTSYNGLGLGAGMGSGEDVVQYSYNDYEGSSRPPQPVHQYNAAVIADYEAQLKNLASQLKSNYSAGKTIVVRGGGGAGAGTQYLAQGGGAVLPHAMSLQGSFQFNYEFLHHPSNDAVLGRQALDALNAQQEDLYAVLGDAYRVAYNAAYVDCGSDYANFACMCPREHAIVICVATEHLGGDPAKVPAWLQQRHCPGDDALSAQNGGGFTSYQQFLLDAATTFPLACNNALKNYFTVQNTPTN